jgi:hypothetical protein
MNVIIRYRMEPKWFPTGYVMAEAEFAEARLRIKSITARSATKISYGARLASV